MGAVVVLTALTLGASRREIMTFALTTFFGTVLTGLVFSRFLGAGVSYLSTLANNIPDNIFMLLEFLVALLLLGWFAERVFFREKADSKEERKESFFVRSIRKGLFPLGVLFAVSALSDPSFLALLTLAGQRSSFLEVIGANCVWILLSQCPLFVLALAVCFGRHEALLAFFRERLARSTWVQGLKKLLPAALSAVILSAGVLALLEALYYLFTGIWLF